MLLRISYNLQLYSGKLPVEQNYTIYTIYMKKYEEGERKKNLKVLNQNYTLYNW